MISNHYTTNDGFCEYKTKNYERTMGKHIEKLHLTPSTRLRALFTDNINIFAEECIAHPRSDLTWNYLTRAAQLGAGSFQSVMNIDKQFMLTFDNEQVPVIGEKSRCGISAGKWLDVFYCAIITRNMALIRILSQVPETIFNADELGSGNFDNQLAELYKAIFNPKSNFTEQLVKSTAAFNPDNFTDDRFAFVSRIFWPQLAIIRTIFSPASEAEFNQEMEKALVLHKERWIKTSDTAARGIISLPLTALAVLAHDHAGYKLTVENGYIPDWLVSAENLPVDTAVYDIPSATPAQATNTTEIPVNVLKALKERDLSELESLREQRYNECLPALIALYEAEEDWPLREGIVYLLQQRRDSKDDALEPLMKDALNSPSHQTRGLALVWLHNDLSVFDQILGDEGIDEQKVARLQEKYLAAQG